MTLRAALSLVILFSLDACTVRDTGSLDLLAASAAPQKHDPPPPPPPPPAPCEDGDACTPCKHDPDCATESGPPARCDEKQGVCVPCRKDAPHPDGAPPPPGACP